MTTNNQYYLEKMLESIRELRSFMAEEFKQAREKSVPKQERKVLICGYTEEEDCLCEATNSLNSFYQDINDEKDIDLDVEEEASGQPPLQSQLNGGSIVPEIKDHEYFLAEIEGLSSSDNQASIQSAHGAIDAYKEEFHVTSKVFDETPERDGYIPKLSPKPPYECGSSLCISSSCIFRTMRFRDVPAFSIVNPSWTILPIFDPSGITEQDVSEYRKSLAICASGFDVPRPIKTFEGCGFSVELMEAISKQAYEKPTSVQCQDLPIMFFRRGVIGIVRTASGKIVGLHVIFHIMDQPKLEKDEVPIRVICALTVELAHQIYLEAKKISKSHGILISAVYGGMSKFDQFKELKAGCELVVATLGRLIDLLKRKALTMSKAAYLVFDEVDRKFDLGFELQIRSILDQIRPDRQTLLLIATVPRKVGKLVREVLTNPIRVTVREVGMVNEEITQVVKVIPLDGEKLPRLLKKLYGLINNGDDLVLASEKATVDMLESELAERGFKVATRHGDKDQAFRMETLQNLKAGTFHVLIITVVAARGCGIKSVKSVVNFNIAKDMDMHVHSIGRTGRAGDNDRNAYTLITLREAQFAGRRNVVPRHSAAVLGRYEFSPVVIEEMKSFALIFDPGGIISAFSSFRLHHNSHVQNNLILMLMEVVLMSCLGHILGKISRIVKDEKLDFMKPDLVAFNAALEGCCHVLELVGDAENVVETMYVFGECPDQSSFWFYFDFSTTYVGSGLICPHIVNCSCLLGAIISWGFPWPFISQPAGDGYPTGLESNNLKGFYGYKVFAAISLILGDSFHNLIKIIAITTKELWNINTKQNNLPVVKEILDIDTSKLLQVQRKQDEVFLEGRIPNWFTASGYVGLVAISTATMPLIFPPLKWYLVLCSYIIALALAFCNSYGFGLTDWSLASTYGQIGPFIIASLVGKGGVVIVGLAACGGMMSIVSTTIDLVQDFKTGYLTLASAKTMFVSQLVGTTMGLVITPLTFWLFWTIFVIGTPSSPYKAPHDVIFRKIAILGVEGFSSLPKHCLAICCGLVVAAAQEVFSVLSLRTRTLLKGEEM